jgi:hypothetical protein
VANLPMTLERSLGITLTSVTIQTRGPRGGESLAHVPLTLNYLTSLVYIDTCSRSFSRGKFTNDSGEKFGNNFPKILRYSSRVVDITIQTRGPRGGESLAHVPLTLNYLTSLVYIDTWTVSSRSFSRGKFTNDSGEKFGNNFPKILRYSSRAQSHHADSPSTSVSMEAHVSPLSNEDDNLEALQMDR